jgi:hypothetical protein
MDTVVNARGLSSARLGTSAATWVDKYNKEIKNKAIIVIKSAHSTFWLMRSSHVGTWDFRGGRNYAHGKD